ncbi:LURP-one-related family protein [Buttiauxella selenatireducens]|uniref:LURP-one-related family protein n=1 Tax=Buttiauxella selenatireducens TaxID=3073902 RepID=A0ABY9S8B3_9ENTR|nr:LURP-one-related family protein [Buttiauxella sp. R73]WMY72307.1 LURP-one-related family protein [Buttiauxella sp. R73]
MLNRNNYLINQVQTEKVFWTSSAFLYEFIVPETKAKVMHTQEPKLSWLTKLFRIDRRYRGRTPFDLTIVTEDGRSIVSLRRGIAILVSKVQIFDAKNNLIGILKQRFSLLHAHLTMYAPDGKILFVIKGDWADWDFNIKDGEKSLATLSKGKGEGILTELFTTKDSYHLKIEDNIAVDSMLRELLIASAIAVDIACNE